MQPNEAAPLKSRGGSRGLPEKLPPQPASPSKSVIPPTEASGGYRLDSCEWYNWGTFNNLWSITPGGHGCLLTGPNGSGKSTLVDALITLLVPNKRRNYNLSSGGERRDRNEVSYVRGAFQRENTRATQVQVKYLREENSVSAIFARFFNPALNDLLTLGQLFWFDNGTLKKLFVVSHSRCQISEILAASKTPKDLRKRLSSLPQTSVFNTFSEYEAFFTHYMGMRSHKALDLFNQVTAIKEIGSLNEFMRQNMLEAADTGEFLSQLFRNYEDLTLAHQAILNAKKQLVELGTIEHDAHALSEVESTLLGLEEQRLFISLYFLQLKERLIAERTSDLTAQLLEKEGALSAIDEEITATTQRLANLQAALSQDQSAHALERLDLLLQQAEEKKASRLKALGLYNQAAKALGLETLTNEAAYGRNLTRLPQVLSTINDSIASARQALFQSKDALTSLKARLAELESEAQVSFKSKNRLPSVFIDIREKLSNFLGVKPETVPFVAELIAVRDDEREWEPAIERLLHGMALRLLVPEARFKDASQFLKSRNLGIKITLHSVPAQISSTKLEARLDDSSLLFEKLRFRPHSPFSEWVKLKVLREYPYVCCDDLRSFHKHDQAITKEGLIKRSQSTVEKDDRTLITDRSRFVLGWDNQEKLQLLQKAKTELQGQLKALDSTVESNRRACSDLEAQRDLATALASWTEYQTLDASAAEKEVAGYLKQRALIAGKNIKALNLRREIDATNDEVLQRRSHRDGLLSEAALLKSELSQLPGESQKIAKELQLATTAFEGRDSSRHASDLSKVIRQRKYDLTVGNLRNFDGYMRELQDQSAGAYRKKTEQKQHLTQGLIKKMAQFKANFPEPARDLDASLDYLNEFLLHKQRLEKDALPEHEERFKSLLSKSTINDITAFKSTLELAFEQIEADISQLNQSLQYIPYSDDSIIQLKMARTKDTDVRDFQNMLKNSVKGQLESAQQLDLEESYHRVKAIIDRLKRDEKWARKVTDVRNWADFFAAESYIGSDQQKNYYSDSSGLSGGQKAKLAFTILGSALAYQYGLNSPKAAEKSFRFVVIDEAFSKSDDRNSEYALQLFKRLGLQLMVVTPADKIHVVEPYVKTIFVTQINSAQDCSQVHTLQINRFEATPVTT